MTQSTFSSQSGNSASDRLASMAHETIDRVTPTANRAEHEVRGAVARAADGATLVQEHAVEAAQQNVRKLRSYIESNPIATVGIAFAAGALLSAFAFVRR
jgi:ElaB/YqjD/DUF883 family membrane-anchored ribosome-binding protein